MAENCQATELCPENNQICSSNTAPCTECTATNPSLCKCGDYNSCAFCPDFTDSDHICQKCTFGYQGRNCTCKTTSMTGKNCETCNSAGTVCESCKTGFQGDNCDVCADNYFESSSVRSTLECRKCEENQATACICKNNETCSTCEIPDTTNCATCKPGTYLTDSTPKTCNGCDPACLTCTGPENSSCTACNQNFHPEPTSFTAAITCVADCDQTNCGAAGNFCDLSSKICTKNCAENCTTCATSTTCGTCEENFILAADGKCGKIENCSQMTNLTTCQLCQNDHFLDNNTCTECSPTTTIPCVCGGNTNRNCGNCGDASKLCGSCIDGYLLASDGSCVQIVNCEELNDDKSCKTCKNGHFKSGDGSTCTLCDATTQIACTCGGVISGNCKTCPTIIDEKKCGTCLEGFKEDTAGSGICIPAGENCTIANCEICSAGGATCQTCNAGYAGEQCDKCADNYTTEASGKGTLTCRGCAAGDKECTCGDIKNCSICTASANSFTAATKCDQCVAGYTDDKCDSCAADHFVKTAAVSPTPIVCEKCDVSCTSCKGSDNQCTKCADTHQSSGEADVSFENPGTCVPKPTCSIENCETCVAGGATCDTCKVGHYGNGSATCTACKSGLNCATCSNGTACDTCTGNFAPVAINLKSAGVTCDTCITGFAGTNCDECADNYAPVIATPEFKTALECSECTDTTMNCKCGDVKNCSKCNIDNPTTPVCEKCARNFTEASKCTTCKEGFKGDTCTDCAEGYFDSTPATSKTGKTCIPCKSGLNCATCSNGDSCDACANNFFPTDNTEKSAGVTCGACKVGETTNCACGVIENCSLCFEAPESPKAATGCFKCAPGHSGDECVKDKEEKKGLSGGAIAGIIIGVIVVVGGVAGGVFYYMKKVKGGKGVSSSSAAMQ